MKAALAALALLLAATPALAQNQSQIALVKAGRNCPGGTNFSRTDLRDVNAYAARFTGASFAGANLTNATFVGTYLGGANFKGAVLDGANFGGAEMGAVRGLTQPQLSKACGDASTILPRGLHIPSCR